MNLLNRTIHTRDKKFTWVQNPISNNHRFFQKLLVFKQLNLQIESCCWGTDCQNNCKITREYRMIQWIFRLSQFAKLPVNRSSRSSKWTLDVIKTKHDVLLPVFVEYLESNQTLLKWFLSEKKLWYNYKFSVVNKNITSSRLVSDRVTMF